MSAQHDRLPAECRAFLDAALAARGIATDDAHARECEPCARRLALHRGLAARIATRPPAPRELASPAFLSGIHERVIEASEASALGERIGAGMAATPPAEGWPEPLLSSAIAADAMSPPASQPAAVWARVRRTILDEVRAAPVSHWRKHLLVAAAGVAATLLVTSLLRDGTPASPTIVFTDLDAMPSVDFAVLRYGALR